MLKSWFLDFGTIGKESYVMTLLSPDTLIVGILVLRSDCLDGGFELRKARFVVHWK